MVVPLLIKKNSGFEISDAFNEKRREILLALTRVITSRVMSDVITLSNLSSIVQLMTALSSVVVAITVVNSSKTYLVAVAFKYSRSAYKF